MIRRAAPSLLGCCLLALLAGPPAAAQTFRFITPTVTDPAITTFTNVHAAIVPAIGVTPRGRLFVFLPGTGGAPIVYRDVVRAASQLGYHGIGLMYVNPQAINSLCALSADPACHEKARLEVLDGEERSDKVNVGRTDSIEHRLIKLLQYLALNYGGEDWGDYLSGTNLVWSKIAIGGHSQGGGHAAMIAREHPVDRCLLMAIGDWRYLVDQPAPWQADPGATPPERRFGFIHVADDQIPTNIALSAWSLMGMAAHGGAQNVDTSAPPYAGSHLLLTSRMPPDTNYHAAVATDLSTPRQPDTTPAYRGVWQFMLAGPPTLPHLDVARGGGALRAVYPTYTQIQYRVQSSTDAVTYVGATAWQMGSGGVATSSLPDTAERSLFRLQLDYD